jgi:hypothetical protein
MTAKTRRKPADTTLHLEVCQDTGPFAWTQRCTCTHLRVGHGAAEHPMLAIGQDRTCTGRNLSGKCRHCGCVRFELAP